MHFGIRILREIAFLSVVEVGIGAGFLYDPAMQGTSPSLRGVLLREWRRFISFIVPFLFDLAIGSAIVLALMWFSWLLGIGRALGLKQDQVEAIDTAHFWLSYGLYWAIGISFLLRVVKGIFRGD
jgi:hypothetical protein